MRVFWILLVLLLLGAGGVLLARPGEQESRPALAASDAAPRRPARRPAPSERPPSPQAEPATSSPPVQSPRAADPEPQPAAAVDTPDPAADVVAGAPGEPATDETDETATSETVEPGETVATIEPGETATDETSETVEPGEAVATVEPGETATVDPVERIASTPVEADPESEAADDQPAQPTPDEEVAATPGTPDETRAATAAQLAADLFASAEQREQESDVPDPPAPIEPKETAAEQRAPETDAGATTTGAGTETTEPATAVPAVVQQDDGSWLVDDRFVLRGTGSRDDPYRVSWEHIVAAAETYKPRKGMTEIPQWIRMLDGRQVKLTGYLAFPLASQTVDEALIMLNQWDGCCIGVPPSPYDGVEVRLSSPIELKEGHFFRFGNVTGTFKVDPYLVNDWLVGLYLIEDAKLEAGM